MTNRDRLLAYTSLWLFALAFGWIEASVVVYLREVAVRENALRAAGYPPNLPVPLELLPASLVAVETIREACTLVLLAAAGWLAGRRMADRIGAFFLAFGIWDITYYAVLRLVSHWPDSLGDWDLLFLIPSPWVAPVWAPVAVATCFVIGGSRLFLTADRKRAYGWTDVGVLMASAGLILAAFLLAGAEAVKNHRMPEYFPSWIFWSGVILGIAWFTRVERRENLPEIPQQ